MNWRGAPWIAAATAAVAVVGCANVGIGLSLPIGRMGGVRVSVGGDGPVGGGAGVGSGGGRVGVGATLPRPPDGASTPASAPLR